MGREWATPVTPLQPGDCWCLAVFPGGLYEFLVHPDEAEHCLAHGAVVDGVRFPVTVVDRFPELNGVLIRLWDERKAITEFVDPAIIDSEEPAIPVKAVA
jgi:hypothetical protein